jgi:ribosomal protein L31
MTDFSDTIVVGIVSDKYSYWEGKKIFTNVGIDVEQFVKRSEDERLSYLQLKIPGGTVLR